MKLSDLPIHHAILLSHVNRTDKANTLWQELAKESIAHRFFNQTVLDIETSRAIISWAQIPYNEEKIALISFHTATIPAQNAMLKMLEEPRGGVRFILITSNTSSLIPTVLSRVLHIKPVNEPEDSLHAATEFLKASHGLRMKLPFISEILTRTDEEGRKDRESIRGFIVSIADALSKQQASSRYTLETLRIASYASDPSASGKALLEYLSCLLPQIP